MVNDILRKQFLRGLAALTRKTGVEIAGCGCCGSPRLQEAVITSREAGYVSSGDGEHVEWMDPGDGINGWRFADAKDRVVR